jgi:hypothetical protein
MWSILILKLEIQMGIINTRIIDPAFNDIAIERIRVTFDNVDYDVNQQVAPMRWPEDLPNLVASLANNGEFWYGITEEGVEGYAANTDRGLVLCLRTGEFTYEDGVSPPEFDDSVDEYDIFYTQLADIIPHLQMPDKILEPLDDEIDVEEGFGDADLDGEPVEPEEL